MNKIKLLSFILLLAIMFSACENKKEVAVPEIKTPAEPEIVYNEYNLVTDSLSESRHEVKKYATLSDIFLPAGFSYQDIQEIADHSKEIFDVKRIRPGHEYIFFTNNDSSKSVKYFIYEIDALEFVVYDFSDSLNIYRDSKEVSVRERIAEGNIEYSLYESLLEKGLSPALAIALSEVYAWQIDFWAIRKGDKFKVVFNEKYVNDEFVGIGDIKSSVFTHRNKDFYAFQFMYNDKLDYFDEKGNSLHKAFLKAPLKFSRISSRFSNSRLHPILKVRRAHHGIDYAAPTGTPVSAVGDGVVIKRKYSGGAGNFVKIKHNGTYTSGYMHLSRYAKGLKVGSVVKQGDVIGYVGSTGLSTGPHLDFRFYKNGQAINYLTMEFPPSRPIPDSIAVNFNVVKDSMMTKMNIQPEVENELASLTTKNE